MRKQVLIIIFTLLLTIECKLYDPEIDGVSTRKIRAAGEIVSLQSSRARIVSAHGERMNNKFMTDPEMTEAFRFLAAAENTNNMWRLVCENDEWSITSIGMLLGIVFTDLEDIEIDVCDAWDLVQEEYSVDSFSNWSLFQPLVPEVERPFFRFATETGSFDVDAITSEIIQ